MAKPTNNELAYLLKQLIYHDLKFLAHDGTTWHVTEDKKNKIREAAERLEQMPDMNKTLKYLNDAKYFLQSGNIEQGINWLRYGIEILNGSTECIEQLEEK